MIRTANLTGSVSRQAGGLFESVRRLVQCLAQTGMDVRVFGTADDFTGADLPAWQPVPVSAFPTWPRRFGYSPRFLTELVQFAPQLVHTHGLWLYSSLATIRYCLSRRVPYLISAHGMLDPWARRQSRWKKRAAYLAYEQAHLRGARVLRALGEPEARALRQAGLRNPIAIIPNGVDLPPVADPRRQVPSPPWHNAVGPGRRVVLFLGRIHPKKGLPQLLEAWALTRETEDWLLAIAGWDQGAHHAELERLCDHLGLARAACYDHAPCPAGSAQPPPHVLFLGPRFDAERRACYAHCHAFILPSLSEGVPMTVLEAWAYAKPVLISPACNLPEAFPAGAALRLEPHPAGIAAGLRHLFAMTAAERHAMGAAGYRLVAERYAWPRVAQDMCRLYDYILGGGPKPPCIADF